MCPPSLLCWSATAPTAWWLTPSSTFSSLNDAMQFLSFDREYKVTFSMVGAMIHATTNSITKRPTRDKGQEKKMNWCMVRQIYCAKSKTWKLRENKEGISVHKRNKERRVNCGSSHPLQFFSPLIGSI